MKISEIKPFLGLGLLPQLSMNHAATLPEAVVDAGEQGSVPVAVLAQEDGTTGYFALEFNPLHAVGA